MTLNELHGSGKATITLQEAAEVLNCDARTVSREIKRGRIEAISMGRRILVLVLPLLKLLGYEGNEGDTPKKGN